MRQVDSATVRGEDSSLSKRELISLEWAQGTNLPGHDGRVLFNGLVLASLFEELLVTSTVQKCKPFAAATRLLKPWPPLVSPSGDYRADKPFMSSLIDQPGGRP